ncbi:exocyst complex component EXO70B1-like [Macadamia integrifolia]|uniref:exocyst complex component EXO70B1-like n=1 Tax=Macadamia integrifolia TaxID=60698 RepID=UPI001C4E9EAC|nr:exocyst complex component EXO70B1-like [Macadamia integrifolia]
MFDGRFSRDKFSDNPRADDPRSYAALDQTLKSLHLRISRYVSADHPHLPPIWSDSADTAAFVDAVDELLSTIRYWDSLAFEKLVASCLYRLDDLLQQSMLRLEDELRLLIKWSAEAFDLSRSCENSEITRTWNFSLDSDSDDDNDDEDGYGNPNGEGEDSIPIPHPVSDYVVLIDGGLFNRSTIQINWNAVNFRALKRCYHSHLIFKNFIFYHVFPVDPAWRSYVAGWCLAA